MTALLLQPTTVAAAPGAATHATPPDTTAASTTTTTHATWNVHNAANDTVVQRMSDMAVMSVPQGGNAVRHYNSPLHDTGAMLLLVLVAFFVLSSYRLGRKYIASMPHNMFSTKSGDDLYRDHNLKDTRMVVAMAMVTSLMEGLMLFYSMYLYHPTLVMGMQQSVFVHVLLIAACCGLFYFLQLMLLRLLGFVFADEESTAMWISAFHASQSALGMALFPVACITLAFPSTIKFTIQAAIFLYIVARLIFICKGFRIFFNNLSLCVYFILYLCAVEIVPPILALTGTVYMCNVLQS